MTLLISYSRRNVHMDALVMAMIVKFLKRSLFLFFTQEKIQINLCLLKLMVSWSLKFFFLFEFLSKFYSGGVTENFEFEIDEESEVWESCSAMLNGNMYIFGGHRNKDVGYKRNQVSINIYMIYSDIYMGVLSSKLTCLAPSIHWIHTLNPAYSNSM